MTNSRVIFWVLGAVIAYVIYRHVQAKTQDFTLRADASTLPNMSNA
jgi:hypothetical protein